MYLIKYGCTTTYEVFYYLIDDADTEAEAIQSWNENWKTEFISPPKSVNYLGIRKLNTTLEYQKFFEGESDV